MLQPARRKYRKEQKGRNTGLATRGAKVSFGEYGLKATVRGRLTARQIEAARRAMLAAKGAINSPLLNDNEIRGAKKVLVNITTGTMQVTMDEIGAIMEYVQDAAGSTDIILGACDDPSLGDKLSVTIIATGFEVGKKTAPYKEQKNVTVYELTDKNEVKIMSSFPLLEEVTNDAPAVHVEVENLKNKKCLWLL